MGFISEFRDFAMRGNVVDMAVGIVIGGAFGKVVSSLVSDVIMPPIGKLTGGVDFAKMSYVIQEATVGADGAEIAEVAINYGMFINAIIDFVIIALCIFLVIKAMNSAKKRFEKEQEAAPAKPSAEVTLLTEIRDSLQKG